MLYVNASRGFGEREVFVVVVVLECTGPMGPFVRLDPTNDPLSSAKKRPPKWRNRKRSAR